jgi:hypothetical protein
MFDSFSAADVPHTDALIVANRTVVNDLAIHAAPFAIERSSFGAPDAYPSITG